MNPADRLFDLSMPVRLLPCPFCGGEARLLKGGPSNCFVQCDDCSAAHADGRPSMALAYALVFESTLRLWDVIGQWVPADSPGISDVVTAQRTSMKENKKWFGLRWEDIGQDLVMRYVPSKTSEKTGLKVTFPLSKAPMVMEELVHWPEPRSGPQPGSSIVCFGSRTRDSTN